ncbi:LysM peptidoglycan-binding domain-containing protein [Leisingera sp. NJS201]|uniref:LysM peptidoglycan-binding domain-containing protein n=1 Tax=Leisingera sp. NJS201 TaxID=2508306 RepID=UPI0020C7B77B|nr:LysM peptidoglycan-binding domain-containing protein [Leisingera sp. NJS201]
MAVLRADAEGIEVVQPAIPADPGLGDEVALDSISYNGSGGVELSGRAQPQSQVRVYVDNRPVAELGAAADGRWSGRLEDVAPGIYTLRLDEVEPATGAVVSRLETPFKREAPEALPQPGGDATPEQPVPLVQAVTVQKGDTLWAISQQKYGSGFLYVRVFEANRGAIRNPDLIYPGQVFTVPE